MPEETCEDCARDPLGYCFEHAVEKSEYAFKLKARIQELEDLIPTVSNKDENAARKALGPVSRLSINDVGGSIPVVDYTTALNALTTAYGEGNVLRGALLEAQQKIEKLTQELECKSEAYRLCDIALLDATKRLQAANSLDTVENAHRYGSIWKRNINLILMRLPKGGVVQVLGSTDVDRVDMAWRVHEAHQLSSNHEAMIQRSNQCACFYCLARFAPTEITDWIDEHKVSRDEEGKRVVGEVIGRTARCPKCGIDSVLGDADLFLLDDNFMHAMQQRWFKEDADDESR